MRIMRHVGLNKSKEEQCIAQKGRFVVGQLSLSIWETGGDLPTDWLRSNFLPDLDLS